MCVCLCVYFTQGRVRSSVRVLTYALPSVCIHMVIWISRETRAGSPTTCLNYSRCFGWKLDHLEDPFYRHQAPPLAPRERERERGGGTEKGDRWKGKRIPHLLSVVCSPKQAEWIIQRWCIIPKEPSANLQSCRCHVEELLRTPRDCLEGSRTVASSLNFLYVSISLIFLQFWKKLLCPWWFESK